ncbi:MAG: hypothetical protein IKB21_01465, partial [Clostridia bacterium]|nr:hypothetical protein [Clostridia bacterium]
RRKKLMRFFGASSLAIIMGAGVLCGTILAPLATHTNTSAGDDPSLTAQEQLLAGTLEFDPENDPVIYTTVYGLDIRWHMAGLPNDPNDIDFVPSGQKLATYAYFTHADVNWVIIGCSNKSTTLDNGVLNLANIASYYQKAGYYNFSNTTSGIWQYLNDATEDALAADLTDVYANYGGFFYNQSSNTISQKDVFPNAKPTDELEFNEVLCFAQNSFSTQSQFYDYTGYGNCYYNSRLMTTLNNFYYNNLADLPIVEKTLKTVWIDASNKEHDSELEGTYKIFPLAGANKNESFYVLNYLTSGADAMQQSAAWWLRSGYLYDNRIVYTVRVNDGILDVDLVSNSRGVRPAFVLEI